MAYYALPLFKAPLHGVVMVPIDWFVRLGAQSPVFWIAVVDPLVLWLFFWSGQLSVVFVFLKFFVLRRRQLWIETCFALQRGWNQIFHLFPADVWIWLPSTLCAVPEERHFSQRRINLSIATVALETLQVMFDKPS